MGLTNPARGLCPGYISALNSGSVRHRHLQPRRLVDAETSLLSWAGGMIIVLSQNNLRFLSFSLLKKTMRRRCDPCSKLSLLPTSWIYLCPVPGSVLLFLDCGTHGICYVCIRTHVRGSTFWPKSFLNDGSLTLNRRNLNLVWPYFSLYSVHRLARLFSSEISF